MRKSSIRKSPFFIFLSIILAVVLGQATLKQHPQKNASISSEMPQPGQLYRVSYVYDGDTVKLENGTKVRFIGIDTPESHPNPKLKRDVMKHHQDEATILALGKKAASFTRRLLQDQQVRLEYDVEPHDRYGRVLAYLYLSDGTFVNQKIIEEGYAYPLTIPPNVKHAKEFKQWFDDAQDNHRGLWK